MGQAGSGLQVEALGRQGSGDGTGVGASGSEGFVMVTFDGTQFAEDVMGYGGHGDVLILREKRS